MPDDSDLLLEIVDRFRYANTEWKDIRAEGDRDMQYVAGDPWEPADRRDRERHNRPCLNEDELNQYFNQTINNVRSNPRAVKFTPQGNGANDATAMFYADKTREIEYRSHAQLAYITAFENCVQRSFGWARIASKYAMDTVLTADPSAFDQELWIEPIVNPNQVVPDPDAKRPDHSDMQFLFFVEEFDKDEFLRRFPKATITNFSSDFIVKANAGDWFKGNKVQVAEYWTREIERTRTMLLLKSGGRSPANPDGAPLAVWKDELEMQPSSDQIVMSRPVDQFRVTQYLTNGVEVLNRTLWKGKYIPFASCLGKVIYVDAGSGPKRQIMSLTRLARSPQMLYAYYCTTEAEIVGAIPKFPYFYYEGQISPENLENLAKSLHEPIAGIAVKATVPTEGGAQTSVLPHPARQPWDPPLQGIQMGKESARRAIQAAMGITPLPTPVQRDNQKSGLALDKIAKSEQLGGFHYGQHLDDMIRHVGVMLEDLIDKIYDNARDTATRKPDETAPRVRINDPRGSTYDDKGQLGGQPLFTKGDHAVTVSSGPAADSQRDLMFEFVASLAQIPEVMQLAGDLIVKAQARSMNIGPWLDELAARLTPQQYKQPPNPQDPKALMAQVQNLSMQNKQAQDAIAKLSMEIKTRVAEYQQQGQIKKMELDAKQSLELMLADKNNATKIEIARISAAKQPADQTAEQAEERFALGVQIAHEDNQAALDREHETKMALLDHASKMAQADQAHQQALEQGDQDISGTLATNAQEAALAPSTETDTGAQ